MRSTCGFRLTCLVMVLSCLLCLPGPAAARDGINATVLDVPPTSGGNDYYVGNRAPLLPSPLIKLPIGNIKADGWLKHQLQCMVDGMSGRLTEISPWCKFEGNAWADRTGKGKFGWEELPYWLKGFIDLGFITGDERVKAEAKRWVEAVITGQQPNGYFGAISNNENQDLWPNMVMLYVLRTQYEATGDPRVLSFMAKYFQWQMTVPFEKLYPGSWQKWRAADNLDSIHWLYNRMGEPWLLEAARVNHERTADWTGTIPTWHGVNLSQCFRGPAQFYQQTRDIRYLKATERNFDAFIGTYGQVPGGLFGSDENCRPGYTGPRQGTETCTLVEFMHSDQMLLKITGNPLWADRCDDIAFNSFPASMTPDLKGLHYLTAANQVQLDRKNKSPMIQNGGDMFSYTPYEQYRCCQHNVAFGWPYYAEHLWMATQGDGLAAVFYVACTVKAKVSGGGEVTITETTDYPFSDTVEFKISAAKASKWPLMLRVPRWCAKAAVEVNGEAVNAKPRPLSWIVIDREWKDGDTVRLSMPMSVNVRVWEKNRRAVSVDRGPLTYSVKIGEEWKPYDSNKSWASYEVFPKTPWNYGLVFDAKNPAGSFEVVQGKSPLAAQPFTPDAAPIQIKAKGKKIPKWKLETNGLIGEVSRSPVRSEEPVEEITLIPLGCARLRVSAFPQIGEGPEADDWADVQVTPSASQVGPNDTLDALNDGLVPPSSGHPTSPRFTWWERRGSTEWVEYGLSEPRPVSWCEVYWYDDSGMGACRVPASWKVMYKDGETWKEVAHASGYGTAKDKFNKVTFDPVETANLRIEVKLQPGVSGGIHEWRYGK